MRKVFIVNSTQAGAGIRTMFVLERGYVVTEDLKEANIICFGGGADITPSLYGDSKSTKTYNDFTRDLNELAVYHSAIEHRDVKPFFVGVCRGAQLLNIMNGGMLYQHVDNHLKSHPARSSDGDEFEVTSTHHQMMQLNPNDDHYDIFLTANQATKGETGENEYDLTDTNWEDIEGVYFPLTRSFCVQYHPEYGNKNCDHRQFFFDKLDMYYNKD